VMSMGIVIVRVGAIVVIVMTMSSMTSMVAVMVLVLMIVIVIVAVVAVLALATIFTGIIIRIATTGTILLSSSLPPVWTALPIRAAA